MIFTKEHLVVLCRFARQYSVIDITLEETEKGIKFNARLKAGKNEIGRSFTLDEKGQLVKNENTTANTENSTE